MHYRLYVFARNNRIVRGVDLDCCNDDAAIVAARAYENEHGLEIWQRENRVAFIQPRTGDGAEAVRDHLIA